MLEQPRLLPVQRGRVQGRLAERATAAQPQAGQRVAALTAKAWGAVTVRDPDRAEQPEVVEVKHGAGARRASRGKRPPAEQRVHVVGMHDIRFGAADSGGHLIGGEASREQPCSCAAAARG